MPWKFLNKKRACKKFEVKIQNFDIGVCRGRHANGNKKNTAF